MRMANLKNWSTVVFLLALQAWSARGDYDCLCAYSVETQVMSSTSVNSMPMGYMYEFDCKPLYMGNSLTDVQPIQFEHKVGYVKLDSMRQVQLCQGSVPAEEKVYTTTTTSPKTQMTTVHTTGLHTTSPTPSTNATISATTTTTPSKNATTTQSPPVSTTATNAASNTTTSTFSTKDPLAHKTTNATTLSSTATPTKSSITNSSLLTTIITRPSSTTNLPTSSKMSKAAVTTTTTSSSKQGSTAAPSTSSVQSVSTTTTVRTTTTSTPQPTAISTTVTATTPTTTTVSTTATSATTNMATTTPQPTTTPTTVTATTPTTATTATTTSKPTTTTTIPTTTSHRPKSMTYDRRLSKTPSDLLQIADRSTAYVTCRNIVEYQCTIPVHYHNGTCQRPWTLYKGSCYLFHTSSRSSWYHASRVCVSNHAHLVFIETSDEDQFLRSHLQALTHHYDDEDSGVWTGGTDDDHEGTWVWRDQVASTEAQFGSYSNWYHNEPDSGDGDHDEDCMCLIGEKGLAWQDYGCKTNMYYVCEMSLVQANTHQPTAAPKVQLTTTLPQCSKDWLQYHDSCYLFSTGHRVKWNEAANGCAQQHAHLAIIETGGEDQFLGTELNKLINIGHDSSDSGTWVGGSDSVTEGTWVWHNTLTGSEKSMGNYRNWKPGEPDAGDGDHDEDCMAMIGKDKFQWEDYKCNEHMFYVCERSLQSSVPVQSVTPMTAFSCQHGWVLHQDSCYHFPSDGNTEWQEAADHCSHDHAYLVIIESMDEQMFLEKQLNSRIGHGDKDGIWTGGNDQHHEGRWEWKNTLTDQVTSMSAYSNWDHHGPPHSDDDCLAMFRTSNYQWQDYRCRNNIFYVCERPALRRFPSLVG